MGTEIFKIDAEMAEKIEVEVGTFNTEINFLTVCHFPNEGCQLQLQFSQPHLLSCGALTSHSLIRSDRPVPVYEDIYVEDASRVETIGLLLMEKFDLFKKFKENPDAHCIVSYIVNSIVRAASGGNTRGIG